MVSIIHICKNLPKILRSLYSVLVLSTGYIPVLIMSTGQTSTGLCPSLRGTTDPTFDPRLRATGVWLIENIYLSDRPQRLFQIVQSKPKKIVANVMYKYNMYLRRGEEGGGTTGRRLGPSEQPLHVRERTHIDTGMHVISASGCLMSQQSRFFCKL